MVLERALALQMPMALRVHQHKSPSLLLKIYVEVPFGSMYEYFNTTRANQPPKFAL